jgi:hypothetical protein
MTKKTTRTTETQRSFHASNTETQINPQEEQEDKRKLTSHTKRDGKLAHGKKKEKKQSKQAIQIRRRHNRSSRTNNQKKNKETKTGQESENCGRQLLT